MMRMSRPLSVVLPIILLLLASSSSVASPPDDGFLLLDAVMPAYGVELFSIRNDGGSPVDLHGLSITDGEGTLTVEVEHLLLPGEKAHFLSGEFSLPLEGRSFIFPSEEVSSRGRFILADAGDEISLYDGDNLLDAFVYGSGDVDIPGWTGSAFPKIGKGRAAIRLPGQDSNSSVDWSLSSLGRSQHEAIPWEGTVEPFLFPDEAYSRIMREIYFVDREICVSIYQLGNLSIASALAELAHKGREVRILMEGNPVGGVTERALSIMAALSEAGCDLRLICSADGYRRYDYLHNKYAIIDGNRVLVTSENWQDSSLTGNRGWGMSMLSSGLAGQLRDVFLEDSSFAYPDIVDFRSCYPDAVGLELPAHGYTPTQLVDGLRAPATLSIVLSPDNSHSRMQEILDSAVSRAYAQQFYTQLAWTEEDRPLRWMMEAAERGVDSRIMLDASWLSSSKDNADVVAVLEEVSLMQACLSPDHDDYNLIHNKGLLVDNSVLVSSINWVDASLLRNRELGILAQSKELANFFAQAFLRDWGDILAGFSVEIELLREPCVAGEPIVLSAKVEGGTASNHTWRLSGQEVGHGERQVLTLDPGLHEVTLTVSDNLGRAASYALHVSVMAPVEEGTSGWLIWAGPPLLLPPLAIVLFRMRQGGRKRRKQQY